MSESKCASGQCLCGSVEIQAETMNTNVGACHCGICRKWSAGPFFAVDCGTKLKIKGEKFVSIYNSSEWAERGFCNQCGTHLFYRLKETQQYIVSAEVFEDKELNFDHQIFIDDKPDYYDFANATHNMTGEEVFAAFTSCNE